MIQSIKLFWLCLLIIGISTADIVAKTVSESYEVFSSRGKKGLLDDSGIIVIPATYDNLGWSNGTENPIESVIGYKENGKWGIISIANLKVTDAIYESIFPAEDNLFICSRRPDHTSNARFGILNTAGQAIVGFQYSDLVPIDGNLLASYEISREKVVYGLISYSESILIPVDYDSLFTVNKGYAVLQDELYAFFGGNGQQLTGFKYDNIQPIKDKYSKCVIRGKTGLLDDAGTEIITTKYKSIDFVNDSTVSLTGFSTWELVLPSHDPIKAFSYDTMKPVSNGVYEVSANGHNALINIEEEIIVEKGQWSIDLLDDQFVLVENNNQYGVFKEGGIPLIPMKYDSIYFSGKHFYALNNGKQKAVWQIYSTFGIPITSTYFEDVRPMGNDLIPVKKNKYWGYIDFSGHVAIDYKYDEAFSFKEGRAKVNYLGNYGVINTAGEWVVQPEHEYIEVINKDLFLSKKGQRYDILNSTGKVVYQTYNKLRPHFFGLREMTSEGKSGLINGKGQGVLPPEFDHISDLKDGHVIILKKDNRWGVVNQAGIFIIRMTDEFEEIRDYSEEFLVVKKDGRYGFIDLDGKLRIANRYDDVQPFSDGMAAIKLLGKWGFIDRLERLRIQPRYETIGLFNNRVAIVKSEGHFGLINTEGENLIDLSYDSIWTIPTGSYMLKQNEQYGLASTDGHLRINPKYDYLQENEDGLVIIEKRGKTGVLDPNGINIIPSIYDGIYYDDLNGYYLLKINGETREQLIVAD